MPDLHRARVTKARGIHFNTIGHSAVREIGQEKKPTKMLELLPEEALYLVERGSLLCYVGNNPLLTVPDGNLPILSAQQAFVEMIGKEDITLEKYQVNSSQLEA